MLEIGDGVFEVKSTNGDTFLGGEDFDKRVIDYLAEEFKKEQGIDLRDDKLGPAAPQGGGREGQDRALLGEATEVNLPFITADQSGPKHLTMKLTRAKLEALVEDLIQKTMGPVKAAIKDAGMSPGEIDEVILVGGMTRMPKVIETVKSLLRQGAAPRRQPGRGGGHGRGDSGRRAARATSRTCCCST